MKVGTNATANWEPCLEQSAANMPSTPGPPGILLQSPEGQSSPQDASADAIQQLLCKVAAKLPAKEVDKAVSALADSLAAALVSTKEHQMQPSSHTQKVPKRPDTESQLLQLQQMQSAQQMMATWGQMQNMQNAALEAAVYNAAHEAAFAAVANVAVQQAAVNSVQPAALNAAMLWNQELLLQQTQQALASPMPTASLYDTQGAIPCPDPAGYSHNPERTYAASQTLNLQQYLPTGGPTVTPNGGGGGKGARRGQKWDAAQQNQGAKGAGRGKGDKSGRHSQQQDGNVSREKSKNAAVNSKQMKKIMPGSSLRVNLEDLNSIDSQRIVLCRKINRLGFESAKALKTHFSKFGEVERVLVAHCHSKSRTIQYRPAGIGFAVMCKAEDAQAALACGHEVEVLPEPSEGDVPVVIDIRSFKRLEVQEQCNEEAVTECL